METGHTNTLATCFYPSVYMFHTHVRSSSDIHTQVLWDRAFQSHTLSSYGQGSVKPFQSKTLGHRHPGLDNYNLSCCVFSVWKDEITTQTMSGHGNPVPGVTPGCYRWMDRYHDHEVFLPQGLPESGSAFGHVATSTRVWSPHTLSVAVRMS